MGDDYTPRYTGDLANPLVITFTDHQGKPYPLQNLNLSTDYRISFVPTDGSTPITGGGSWALVTTGADGAATYSWASGDVATPGKFAIRAAIRLVTGWLDFDAKIIECRDPALPG